MDACCIFVGLLRICLFLQILPLIFFPNLSLPAFSSWVAVARTHLCCFLSQHHPIVVTTCVHARHFGFHLLTRILSATSCISPTFAYSFCGFGDFALTLHDFNCFMRLTSTSTACGSKTSLWFCPVPFLDELYSLDSSSSWLLFHNFSTCLLCLVIRRL